MLLAGVGKIICTTPFLDAQDLQSQITWKQMSYIPVYLVGKFFFQRRRKPLSGGVPLSEFGFHFHHAFWDQASLLIRELIKFTAP